MQPEPIGFGVHICAAQADKTTIFFFFFCLLSHILSELQLSLLFLPPCFWCVCHSFLLCFSFAFICPGNANWAQCSFLILLHIHTWELPTVITVLSRAAMCSSSSAGGASLTCLDCEGKECYCYSFTSSKGPGIWTGNLPVTQLCLQAYGLLRSCLLWSTSYVYKQLLREKVSFFMTKSLGVNRFTPLRRWAVPNDVFPSQTQLTPLNRGPDVCPFLSWWTGEPSRTRSATPRCVPRAGRDEPGGDLYQRWQSDRAHIR